MSDERKVPFKLRLAAVIFPLIIAPVSFTIMIVDKINDVQKGVQRQNELKTSLEDKCSIARGDLYDDLKSDPYRSDKSLDLEHSKHSKKCGFKYEEIRQVIKEDIERSSKKEAKK